MAKRLTSIFTDDMNTCFLTGSTYWVERHHIFGGANRKKSELYGLVLPITHIFHNEPEYGIHHNEELDLMIKQYAQRRFEEIYSHELFMLEFGKNYLYEETDGYELDLSKFGIQDEMCQLDPFEDECYQGDPCQDYFNQIDDEHWEAC